MVLKRCIHRDTHPNCRFRDDLGRCYILTSTFFNDGICKFYKLKKEGEIYDPNRDYYKELMERKNDK